MKIEYKSMFLGVALGVVGVFAIFFLLGDFETEFSVKTGKNVNKMDKNIDVRIEKIVENGQNLTNVVVKGSGDVTKEDLDIELDRIFKEHDINKNDSNINIEMEING